MSVNNQERNQHCVICKRRMKQVFDYCQDCWVEYCAEEHDPVEDGRISQIAQETVQRRTCAVEDCPFLRSSGSIYCPEHKKEVELHGLGLK
jgi:hypothetical protein